MKLKALFLALLVAGLTASFALAKDGPGQGQDKRYHGASTLPANAGSEHGKSPKCRPSVELEVRGSVASAPSGGMLALAVAKGGSQGVSLAGKQLTFDVTDAKLPAGLAQGDLVQVHGRACVDLVAGTAKLVATHVSGKKGAGHDGGGKDDDSPTTSTTTTVAATTAAVTTTTAR